MQLLLYVSCIVRHTALRHPLQHGLKAIFAACLPIYLYYTLVIHVEIKSPCLSVLATVENYMEALIHPLSTQTPGSPANCVTGSCFSLPTDICIFTPQLHVLEGMLSLGTSHVSVLVISPLKNCQLLKESACIICFSRKGYLVSRETPLGLWNGKN